MLRTGTSEETQLEIVALEELVRPDHLLRKINKHVDFSFIIDKVRPLYSPDNGRPSLDPIVLFKMLFIGYLFGIRSERRLVQEIADNVAYRWFLGIPLRSRVPSASTIWENRRRRWKDTELCQQIFDEIVKKAVEAGLVDGTVLYSDGTIIKANANKRKYLVKEVPESTRRYMDELEKAVDEDRVKHGKKRLRVRREVTPKTREVKESTTDPDSSILVREGKPECFAFTEHRTVDSAHNIITDVHVTGANVHDSVPFTERLARQIEVFGFDVQAVGLDAGYHTAWISHWLEAHNIVGVIAHRRFKSAKHGVPKSKFEFDREKNEYRCPGGKTLTYRTTNREGYREYKNNPGDCLGCPLFGFCTKAKNAQKTITRHVWEDDREKLREHRLSESGKVIYKRRKETIERSFADAKELHGLRYARMRGLARVREQCLMTAAAQNIKKLAMILDRRERRALCTENR